MRQRAGRVALSVCVPLTLLSTSSVFAQTASFQGLGFLGNYPGTQPYSGGRGISADGLVVVGHSSANVASANEQAFRWTAAGGMVGLGYLGGSANTRSNRSSTALSVSRDGAVIVGNATNLQGMTEAFRWTEQGGMVGLGFLANSSFRFSQALGTNSDGSVVVGTSATAGSLFTVEAFRWTQAGGMVGLGVLGSTRTTRFSTASATNGDGSVVVGDSSNGLGQREAFRWTSSTGMVGLGFIGGAANTALTRMTLATAVSTDGTTVVGWGENVARQREAFRWTQANGLVGLGFLSGASGDNASSTALATNGDGAIVVGYGRNASGSSEAFRWTQTTGMRSLSALMSAAGVNLGTWRFSDAAGISANGQFITGTGVDPNGNNQAYLVRYQDSATGLPIAGMTTFGAVQASLDKLAGARQGMMVQQHAFAAPLLGASQPLGTGSEVGAFVSGGSLESGGTGRVALGNGISLLGGLAYQRAEYNHAEVTRTGLGAMALRYVADGFGLWSPFAEAGGWITADARFRFKRPYANGVGLASGVGESEGQMSYVYGRLGTALRLTPANEFALSAEIGREELRVKGYSEPVGPGNPFEARILKGTDGLDIVKAKAQWTHAFSEVIDGTIYVAGAHAFGQDNQVWAQVTGFGTLSGAARHRANWLEYGARVGYRLTQNISVDLFADAISGRADINTRVHGGAALRWRF